MDQSTDKIKMQRINFFVGLFLITACTLMLQLIQTRILSVVAWYHLAFFTISMAMFGLTVGAVWVYLRAERFTEKTLSYDLSWYSTAFAISTAVCLAVQMTLVPLLLPSITSFLSWGELAICIALPFFFSGVIVSLALTRSPFPIGLVYGVDLLGAATGCIGVLFILNSTDGPSAVLWVGVIAAIASIFFIRSGIGGEPESKPTLYWLTRRRGVVLFVVLVAAIANGSTDYGLQPIVVKGGFQAGGYFRFKEWNSFSRITVTQGAVRRPSMWGPSPTMPKDIKLEQRGIDIDADASTVAYRFTGDLSEVDFLKYDITNLVYALPGHESTAIIGVGGGRDILSAALFGVKDITGVEVNPILVNLLTDKSALANFTELSALQGIEFFIDEGRSWFARTKKSFDVIHMALASTWAATGAGAFTLSENGLYTIEAWKIFTSKLNSEGILTVSRWYLPGYPSETGRLLSLSLGTLMQMGIQEPRRHVFLATQGRIATLLLSRSPFSKQQIRLLKATTERYQYNILVTPDESPTSSTLNEIVNATDFEDLIRYTSSLAFDLTPPTDDRPFFFNQLPLSDPVQMFTATKELLSQEGGIRKGNLLATATLAVLFVVSFVLVTAAIVIPLRPAIRDVGKKLAVGGTMYFLLIGVGFMMVEIALLQRTSVFLGHPTYSLSVLLFTLILATGVGSLLSDRIILNTRMRFAVWSILTSVYILCLPLWLPSVFLAFDSAILMVRAAICVLTLAPAGVLMGFGFPTGMRLISVIDKKPTPWFWGVNGAAGVLASIFAVANSIGSGISATLMIGAACYLFLIPVAVLVVWSREAELSA